MSLHERTLALAGIFQAVYLVQQTARRGAPDAGAFEASIASILNTEAADAEAAYGGVERVQLGLRQVADLLKKRHAPEEQERMRYAVAVMALERRLSRRPDMLKQIGEGLERARAQARHFSLIHPNLIANLAGLYSDTVSVLGPRIMVAGEQHLLANPEHAARIRALLLAAIRAAVLWRQQGGSHLRLIFGSGRAAREAQAMLENVRL